MSTPRLAPEATDELADRLRRGEVGVVPTDTAYGLAASVESGEAVGRVFEIKDRSTEKSVPLLTTGEEVMNRTEPPKPVRVAMDRFWPGGLTLVVPVENPENYPPGTTRDDTLALREPAHAPLITLLRRVGMITGTSANPSGGTSPGSLAEVDSTIINAVDFVMDGPEVEGTGSTVAEWDDEEGNWIIHRAGPVTVEQLRDAIHHPEKRKDTQ